MLMLEVRCVKCATRDSKLFTFRKVGGVLVFSGCFFPGFPLLLVVSGFFVRLLFKVGSLCFTVSSFVFFVESSVVSSFVFSVLLGCPVFCVSLLLSERNVLICVVLSLFWLSQSMSCLVGVLGCSVSLSGLPWYSGCLVLFVCLVPLVVSLGLGWLGLIWLLFGWVLFSLRFVVVLVVLDLVGRVCFGLEGKTVRSFPLLFSRDVLVRISGEVVLDFVLWEELFSSEGMFSYLWLVSVREVSRFSICDRSSIVSFLEL